MSKFGLDGEMIPRQVRRLFDERSEPRDDAGCEAAVLEIRGRRHVVRIVNLSRSGAMLAFSLVPNIGEEVVLQLPGRPRVTAKVLWVREGRIGVNFLAPLE